MLRKGDIIILLYINNCAIAALTNTNTNEVCTILEIACDLKSIGPIKDYLSF